MGDPEERGPQARTAAAGAGFRAEGVASSAFLAILGWPPTHPRTHTCTSLPSGISGLHMSAL